MKDFIVNNVNYNSTTVDIHIRKNQIANLTPSVGPALRQMIPGGFMDLHCHGAAGYKTIILTREAYQTISIFLAQHGVTSFLATFSAAPLDAMTSYVNFAEKIMKEGLPGAQLAGIYLEGPCLKNVGGMNPELLCMPTEKNLKKLLIKGQGIIKIMTLAPELTGAFKLIELLAANDIVPAIGHSSANADTVRKAVQHGLKHITHLGNNGEGDISCVNGRYRHDGPLLEMLVDDDLSAEIIVDGIHVDPKLVKLFYQAKGINNCAAVTDVCAAAGIAKEKLFFPDPAGHMKEFTAKNGALYIADTDRLTGSLLTMDKAFTNIRNFAGLSPEEAAKSCGAVPRRIVGLPVHEKIIPGSNADFTVLSDDDTVELTVVNSKIIYQKKDLLNE